MQTTLGDLVGDDETLNLRGALPDPVDPKLAPDPLDWVVAHVSAAAEDLHRAIGDPVGGLGGGQLGGRGPGVQRLAVTALIELPGHLVCEGAVDGYIQDRIGDHSLDELAVDQRLPPPAVHPRATAGGG